ncbi:MAG: hypothetical protein KAT65_03925 [Methanophagales archaeon]|nr:hypothetical protein [Methanophagales archaeon]
MPELSEKYIFIRSEVRGEQKLDAAEVNPLLQQYRRELEKFKIEEPKRNGGLCKTWVQLVEDFKSEILNEGKTLLFSHQLKVNIFDSLPHSHNNYAHSLQVKLAKGIREIYVDNGKTDNQKIFIVTTGIKFSGGVSTEDKWPTSLADRAFL